jgi:hypothetical protein
MEVVIIRRGTTEDDVSASFRGEKGGASGDSPPATTRLVYKQGGGLDARNTSLVCPGCIAFSHAAASLRTNASSCAGTLTSRLLLVKNIPPAPNRLFF